MKLSNDSIKKQIEDCSTALKNGGVVAYPTDTVYGLGARFDDLKAVEKLFRVKQRSGSMALPLLLADRSWIEKLAADIPDITWNLVETFMPGALTIILKKSTLVPDLVSGGMPTIALRIPGHQVTLDLIDAAGFPITGTSANISGQPSTHTAAEVASQFGDTLDYILDGGRTPGGIESTIIDVTGEVPVIVRNGAIPREKIEQICPLK